MKDRRTYLIIASAILLSITACKKDSPTTVDLGYDYMPDQVGTWVIYDVMEIHHDTTASIKHDTSWYQIREIVESHFIDNEGRESQRIERYRRDSLTGPWVIADVWYATLTPFRAEKIEENETYIKLTFPPRFGDRWDGNAYNMQLEWEYIYTVVDQPGSFGGFGFDSICTVLQRENHNLVEYEQAVEVYAKGVGMVYKRFKDLTIYNFDTLQINRGDELVQVVYDHGN